MPTLDPISLLAAIGSVTQHIGLVATVSTTYNAVDALAERFATLDRICGGRSGWNIVTTAHPATAPNFGDATFPEKAQRYARAVEFVAEACALLGRGRDHRCRRAARCWSRPASRATGALLPPIPPRRSSALPRPSRPASPSAATCAAASPKRAAIPMGCGSCRACRSCWRQRGGGDCQGRGAAGAGRRGAVHRVSERIDGLRPHPVRSRRADPGRSDHRGHAAAQRGHRPNA